MVYAQVFKKNQIVTWLIKAMTNTGKIFQKTFHTKTPKFWSSDLLWVASIVTKIDASKYYFVIINFKNVVGTLGDSVTGYSFWDWLRNCQVVADMEIFLQPSHYY